MFLDVYINIAFSPSTSELVFENLLEASKNDFLKYKSTSLAFAFWLFKTSLASSSYLRACKYFRLLDTVLIIYGPDPDIIGIINRSVISQSIASTEVVSSIKSLSFDTFNGSNLVENRKNILILKDPSISEFERNVSNPIIIEGLISNWPALKKWSIPSFWIETAGHRFFPVEIGTNYESNDWYQEIIQLNEYFKSYVFADNNSKIAYIAQHNWVHQIPCLSRDFEAPDICDIFLNPDQDQVLTHMWFGMKGTISPLHFDKYDNIFSQIVGRKHFVLVDPKFSHVITFGTGNTCKIDDGQILEFLTNNNIPYHEFILSPGESLYIPSKWWHQVKSLSFSISISFWF